jgi:hypothetical protein
VRIAIRGDDEDGWFLDWVGHERVPHPAFYTGPFESRADAARAIPEYRKVLERALDRR